MSERSVTHFQVGNGNCCLIRIDEFCLLIDTHGTAEKSSYEILEPLLPERNGSKYIDVYCNTHGDQDHCGGFEELISFIEDGDLIIGSIWHPNYDRIDIEGIDGLSNDYIALHSEIVRRREVIDPEYGDIEVPLTAWDTESDAFVGLDLPSDFSIRVLSPYLKDEGDESLDVNDMSLVLNVSISGLNILFAGDSSSKIWQERIIPYTLDNEDKSDWAKSDILVVSHHGSFTFFGENREDVRDADPYPGNYPTLDFIEPNMLIISATSKFPLSGDCSGEQPPHYAAWKWYHQWFREKHGIDEDDKHPDNFKYTSDGHIRMEHKDGKWVWKTDWSPDEPEEESSENVRFVYHGGETRRDGSHYA